MPRLCSICTLPLARRQQIDAALIAHTAGYRAIAGQFRVARTSLQRHAAHHLGALLRESEEATHMLDLETIGARLMELDQAGREVLADDQHTDHRLFWVGMEASGRNLERLYRLRVAAELEADMVAERKHQQQEEEQLRTLLREGPPLSWLQPVRCRDGVGRAVTVHWQPWMGPKESVRAVVDAAEAAGMGDYYAGKTLDELNGELAAILCRGPEGAAWMQHLADAAQAAAEEKDRVKADPH